MEVIGDLIMRIHFRELTKLQPTLISTVIKLVEETGELSREIQRFNTGSHKNINELLGELMDVAQTTATLTFVLEHHNSSAVYKAMELHLCKLKDKGYIHSKQIGEISLKDGQLVMFLPRLDIQPDLTQTFLKLAEEAGELVQIVGKRSGLSGESRNLLEGRKRDIELSLALLDVAQCCVTMLYIMAESYNVDVGKLMEHHENKLREHGYL